MPPLLRFIILRFLSIPVTVLIITMILYAFVMITPPETRAQLYFSGKMPATIDSEERIQRYTEMIIRTHHLRDPYPVQFLYWLGQLLDGQWGYSPILKENILPALIRRTPVTIELTLYSLLVFFPLGLITGMIAGWRKHERYDQRFRAAAFIASSIPMFILALVLLDIFYVAVYWFPPERLSIANSQLIISDEWRQITGLVTIDGLLNGQPDVSLDGLRHLVLPVVTLSLMQWATLGRIARVSVIDEAQKDYILAARAHGVNERGLLWGHTFRNILTPALNSTALSVAWLVTGVYVVEIIFNFNGISDVVVRGLLGTPDASSVLGFAIYNVILVCLVMFALDIIQVIVDPRLREGLIAK